MAPLSQSLPQLVHNAKEIFTALLAPLLKSGREGNGSGKSDEEGASAVLSADALAALHVALARDLQRDWLEGSFLEELSAAWGLWLKERPRGGRGAPSCADSDSSSLGGNGGKDARVLAAAFGCMGGVFRHLGRGLSERRGGPLFFFFFFFGGDPRCSCSRCALLCGPLRPLPSPLGDQGHAPRLRSTRDAPG